jgi:hypothetical protein
MSDWMDKDSTKLERSLIVFYVFAAGIGIWTGAMAIAVFSAFCLGFAVAMYGVIKGWTRYYRPPFSDPVKGAQ